MGQQDGLDDDRAAVERQIVRCDRDLQKWEKTYLGDIIDLPDFAEKKADITARRNACEKEIARLDAQRRQIEQAMMETATLTDYCKRVAAVLEAFSMEEKRVALHALGITVVWHHDKPLAIQGSIPVAVASDAPCCRPRRAHGHCRRCRRVLPAARCSPGGRAESRSCSQ